MSDGTPVPVIDDRWSVKEVVADLKHDIVAHLDKQDVTLADIRNDVSGKADKADVVSLGAKIDGHAQRITTLEEHRADDLSSKRFRTRVWAVIGSVSGIAAIIVGSLISAHH